MRRKVCLRNVRSTKHPSAKRPVGKTSDSQTSIGERSIGGTSAHGVSTPYIRRMCCVCVWQQQLTTEEVEKRARRRELNRLAAKRSREKGQRRKDTLIQEIQGLQGRNGSLEGAMASLVEERDNLVQTLKGHLPHCQDSAAMTRSAQLLAFSNRLAQLLDWTIPGPSTAPVPLPSASSEQSLVLEIQTPTPAQTSSHAHSGLHSREPSSLQHGLSSPSTPLGLGTAPPTFPSPGHHAAANLSSPSSAHYSSPSGRSHAHGSILPPHLPSPSHLFPSPHSTPSAPRPSHLALDPCGGGRDPGSQLVSYTGTGRESCKSPLSNPALLRSAKTTPGIVKRPQSLDLRGVGIIPKKDPALRSPVIPKKDPAMRSPVIPKKDPALRSPTIPKKDPALRSPIIETSLVPPVTATSSSALRISGIFKRGPVQRVASFHGVSGQNAVEQETPLNLSKRRKSEDYGSMADEQNSSDGQQSGFSGLNTWPPPGPGPWVKQEEERESPLNLVCREQPSATVTSGQGLLTPEASNQPYSPLTFKQKGLVPQDTKDELTSSGPQRHMRYNSYDGSS
ncbi:hypothetical protein ACOMHN_026566 [Nucella lapillus]